MSNVTIFEKLIVGGCADKQRLLFCAMIIAPAMLTARPPTTRQGKRKFAESDAPLVSLKSKPARISIQVSPVHESESDSDSDGGLTASDDFDVVDSDFSDDGDGCGQQTRVPSRGTSTHSLVKPPRPRKYACSHDGCLKSYTKPSRLAEHERSHNGEVAVLLRRLE